MATRHESLMSRALDLAERSARTGTGPFGCVVVRRGKVIAEGWNEVTKKNDPTAHAEIQAMRKACRKLKNFELTDCEVYTSAFPCAMCLAALYWARPRSVYYLNTTEQAAQIGFDDEYIYKQIKKVNTNRDLKVKRILLKNSLRAFDAWQNNPSKIEY